ncbi:thioredoxin domain-containing protein [Streptomyces sp. Li-HN-5-11]|uniref:DsbA family protein n=1 Tax=Streptomyces sp. Li-HN-5-11 TaxID=3075432 RepID=UPI0028AE8651|nr:thioredoxin domain-containing protein [Streptomyces sp. Li-HN-5-11]WNM34491.1 thioredoxin domain-containing protein [Streptomyces sp. Li-HN-5-11]
MSEKNQHGKRTARERLAVEREKQKATEKRRRTLIVTASVVCVLGLATVIGVVAASSGKHRSSGSGPVVAPSGAQGKDSLAIPVGKEGARSTLTVWEDFRCPACRGFEAAFRPTIHQLTGSGRLRVEYHLVRLIDGNLGGSGSLRAANAAACAQDAGKFAAYHDVLYDNQPEETSDSYSDNARLIKLAGKVSGLDTPAFQKCVKNGTHDSWVDKSHQAFKAGNFSGTPTLTLNGKSLNLTQLTPAKLKQMVEAADKG